MSPHRKPGEVEPDLEPEVRREWRLRWWATDDNGEGWGFWGGMLPIALAAMGAFHTLLLCIAFVQWELPEPWVHLRLVVLQLVLWAVLLFAMFKRVEVET